MVTRRTTLTLSQACTGFIYYKTAVGMSPHTIADYRNTFNKLKMFYGDNDPVFGKIPRQQMVDFFAWLQNEHVSTPGGCAKRPTKPLAPKSIFNIHTNMSSLWHWGVNEGYVEKNLIRTIDPPPYEEPVIVPLSRDEIAGLLKVCDTQAVGGPKSHIRNRATGERDRCIILVLVDTGIRAEELCNLTMTDLNLSTNSLTVRGKGAGKDKAKRVVHFGKIAAQALWKYIAPRLGNPEKAKGPLFLNLWSVVDSPLNRNALLQLLHRLGERAGINDVHPHRFRHTFAINYLRNGGDVFTLQQLLGHSDLEMVKRYARIAQTDCADAHRKASPADNWRL